MAGLGCPPRATIAQIDTSVRNRQHFLCSLTEDLRFTAATVGPRCAPAKLSPFIQFWPQSIWYFPFMPEQRRRRAPCRAAAGAHHSVLAVSDGIVWAWGGNSNGELGDNSTTTRRVPQPVAGLANIVAVTAGTSHSLALTAGGEVFAFGDNLYGQIGDGTTTDRRMPVLVPTLSSIIAIAAGEYHSIALRASGEVYVWGRNNFGQMGNGGTTNVNAPSLLTTDAQAIAGGATHTLVVKNDGTVWGVGADGNGQLSRGSVSSSRTALAQSVGLADVVAAAAGARYSVFLRADGTLMAAGYNAMGQLGDGTTTQRTTAVAVSGLTNIAAIDSGTDHTLAAAADGTLWAWGAYADGRLGTGATVNQTSPVVVGAVTVAAMAAGHNYSLALTPAGSVLTWGDNASSQLGDGATTDQSFPTAISESGFAWKVATPTFSPVPTTYSAAQAVNLAVVTGDAEIFYTLNGSEPTQADTLYVTGTPIAITENQTIKAKAWKTGMPVGNTATGTYVLKVTTPTASPGAGTYTSVRTVTLASTTPGATIHYTLDNTAPTTGSAIYAAPVTISTSAVLKTIAVKPNWATSDVRSATYTMSFGTLTPPTISPSGGTVTGSVAVEMTAQPFATIRYTTNGSAPTLNNSSVYIGPFAISTHSQVRARAFHPDYTMSPVSAADYSLVTSTPTFNLPPGAYAPGTTLTVGSPDAGVTLRWTIDGTDPTSTSPVLPTIPILVADTTIKVRAFRSNANESAVATAAYTLTTPMSAGVVSAGERHTLVTTPEGTLYAWGANSSNQLGDGTLTTRTTPILVPTLTGVVSASAGALHNLAVDYEGRLWAWGYNGSGRLGDGTSTNRSRPVAIDSVINLVRAAAGGSHSLALTSAGEVYAWGLGSSGQLGQGTTASSSVPVLVPGLANVVGLAAGANHSLALTATGQVWAWGDNASNQVASGPTTDRLSPTLIAEIANAVDVSAGGTHSFTRLRDGSLRAWGSGAAGRLGLGTITSQPTPVAVPGIVSSLVAAGTNHSGALAANGTLLGWGANSSGQVGNGTVTSTGVLSPIAVLGPFGVTALALGATHSVAASMDGGVWTWGSDLYAQLGDPGANIDRPVPAQVWTAPGRWSPPPPMLSLPSGTYTTEQVVLVTDAVPGATLRYSTTEADPTEADPEVPATGDVLITGTMTIKARAWVPDRVPSAVTTATYILQPAAPTVTPAAGTYVGPQTVTLSTVDPLATIRFTIDGTTPTDTSPVYGAPFVLAATTTIHARAFRNGWTPSATSSASLVVMQGTLATPTASPAGGSYRPTETVTLNSQAGSTIRYTTDGSEPTEMSSIYVGPLSFPEGDVTLRAKAFQPDWVSSGTLTQTYTFDGTPPTITARAFPTPNTAGWNNSPVTVIFHCADNIGVSSCPQPILIDQQGADQSVSGQTTDGAGHIASVSLTVNLDSVPPTIALTTSVPDETSVTPLTLTGPVSDDVSGVNQVLCNGNMATVTGGGLSCSLPLRSGRNALVVSATDLAGNSASASAHTLFAPVERLELIVTPPSASLLVGESRTLIAHDQFGRLVTDVTWASSDSAVASITADGEVLASGAGTATLTAVRARDKAAQTIEVFAGGALPAGTPRWSVPPVESYSGGAFPGTVVGPPTASGISIFSIEHDLSPQGFARPLVRALRVDGSQAWTGRLPTSDDESIGEIRPAASSGLVAVAYASTSGRLSLVRAGGDDGTASWRYESVGRSLQHRVSGDGTIMIVEEFADAPGSYAYVVGLSEASGAVQFRYELPSIWIHRDQPDGGSVVERTAAEVEEFEVGSDGRTRVLIKRGDLWRDTAGNIRRHDLALEVHDIALTGIPNVVTLDTFVLPNPVTLAYFEGLSLTPDGSEGVLATWQRKDTFAGPFVRKAAYVGPSGVSAYSLDPLSTSGGWEPHVASHDGIAIGAPVGGGPSSAIDMRTGGILWGGAVTGRGKVALDQGGRSWPPRTAPSFRSILMGRLLLLPL